MTRIRILIVEDSPAYQEMYQEMLEIEYDTLVVDNKIDAQRLLRQQTFDIAIIDMRLKEDEPDNIDGLDVAELIRDLDLRTAMIMKSGFPTDERNEVVSRMRNLNFTAVLDKSAEEQIKELLNAVHRAIANV